MTHFSKYIKKYVCIICLLFITQLIIAQDETFSIPDSLSNKTYDYLYSKLQKSYSTDSVSSRIYMKTYLAKAITENNGYRRFNAYRYLAYYARKKEVKFNFYEKALKERGSLDDPNKIYLYIQIGLAHYDYYEYEAAMNYYLKGLKLAQRNNDKWSNNSEYMLFHNIAKIKEDLGKYDEALAIYKKNSAYEILQKDTIGNIATVMNIAQSMRYNKKYDSASYYYHAAIDKIYKHLPDYPSYVSMVTINEGINLFYKKDYRGAEKLLQKEFSQVDFNNIELQKYYILTSLYLGKIQQTYYHETEKAKTYFIKVDSLVSKVKAIIPETIEAYEFLINYYDENGNVEKQLDAVTKLYQLRTTMSSRKINTVNILHSEFDTPELLKNKELLIQKLEGKTNKLNTRVLYLIAFGFLFFLLFILQYFKRRQYKKRFNAIILELDSQKTKSISHSNLSIMPQLASIIDEATVTAIAKKLDSFEAEKGFLQNDLNVAMVAKKCDTNAKYLSKIIHTYKEKSFVNYINNLRIDYILKELKENTILQKYTIKSISEEAGFNTAESFATAFKKRAGIRPSYYIRNLKSK